MSSIKTTNTAEGLKESEIRKKLGMNKDGAVIVLESNDAPSGNVVKKY
jgi:hypothetical protein